MRKATKILSAVALCAVMVVMSVVTAFASPLGYLEDHNRVDCANRYVDGSCYKILIKISNEYNLSNIWVDLYDADGYVDRIDLDKVSEKPYASLVFEYNHSDCNYYTLTIDTSNPSIPSGLIHKLGVKIYCSYNYKATDTYNGNILEGPGYWLSR